MRIVMLGPPGAGKGTQSARLARALGVPHLSTGDILRTAINDRTSLGIQAQAAVNAGELVDDEIINGCVRDRLVKPDAKVGFILDGFPRTVDQAAILDRILGQFGTGVDVAFEMLVDIEHLFRRIARRADEAIASGAKARADDNEETLRRRLESYGEHAASLSAFYRAQGRLVPVDGLADMDTVFSKLTLELEALMSRGLPAA